MRSDVQGVCKPRGQIVHTNGAISAARCNQLAIRGEANHKHLCRVVTVCVCKHTHTITQFTVRCVGKEVVYTWRECLSHVSVQWVTSFLRAPFLIGAAYTYTPTITITTTIITTACVNQLRLSSSTLTTNHTECSSPRTVVLSTVVVAVAAADAMVFLNSWVVALPLTRRLH